MTHSKERVTILGAGVLGLSCATRLHEAGYDVSIFARDLPEDLHSQAFASPWAGANWASFATVHEKRYHAWEKFTFNALRALNSPLIMDCPGVNYYVSKESHDSRAWFKDFLPNYQVIPEKDLPDGQGYGATFTTLTMDAPAYLLWLAARLRSNVVPITRRTIPSLEHAYTAVEGTSLVVNCTALGSKSLIGVQDENVEPIKGQTVLVHAPNVKATISKIDEKPSASYLIPRPNGNVILGGCFKVGVWDLSVDYSLASDILNKCYALDPSLSDNQGVDKIKIISHNVGLRPARKGGPRLEKEIVKLPLGNSLVPLTEGKKVDLPVVHCYGIGGSGYQSSWGMAEEVLGLIEDHFKNSSVQAKL